MENIYRSWTEFNKFQNKAFKNSAENSMLDQIEKSTEVWKDSSYPQGEYWRYVKYDQLPTTHFRWPSSDEPSKQLADENFFAIDIRNFKTPQKFVTSAMPEGLLVVSEAETSSPRLKAADSENPFSQLAHSFFGLGLEIKISKEFSNKKPLKLIFNFDQFSEKDLFFHQNVSLDIAEGACATVLVETRCENWSGLSNLCFVVKQGKRSNLKLVAKEVGGSQSHCVLNVDASVQQDAKFKMLDFTMLAKWSRHNTNVRLTEKGSVGELIGAYLNNAENFVDHHTAIFHKVGYTESKEDYRGILANKAQAVFNGKIHIAEKAAKSNSEQINKNLMLSDQAEVDTKPELQIYNDDVKAAHGATVGQLDSEQMFYLQSRGYSKIKSRQVLAKAFVFDLTEDEDEVIKSFLNEDLEVVLAKLEET